MVSAWIAGIDLDPALYGTHSLRSKRATLIYRRTGNLRAVQLLLGHRRMGPSESDQLVHRSRQPNDLTIELSDGGLGQSALFASPLAMLLKLRVKWNWFLRNPKVAKKSKPSRRKTHITLPSERRIKCTTTGTFGASPIICQSANVFHGYLAQVGIDAQFARHPNQISRLK
jgi:hypothetical protein